MTYDIDEMIAETEAKLKEGEVMVFALGVGRIAPQLGHMKQQKKTMNFIKNLDGFIGIYPVDLWHNLLLFDSLNDAKAGKNQLKAKNAEVGNVAPVIVRKSDVDGKM